MSIGAVVKVCIKDVRNEECPITYDRVAELKAPLQILPCQHIFEGENLKSWLQGHAKQCPIDTRAIISLHPVVFTENPKNAEEENLAANSGSLGNIPQDKIEALKMLERSLLVAQCATKNFIHKADQITIEWLPQEETRDGIFEKIGFRGAPIDQLYGESMRCRFVPTQNECAEAILRCGKNREGKLISEGYKIHVVDTSEERLRFPS